MHGVRYIKNEARSKTNSIDGAEENCYPYPQMKRGGAKL